MNKHNFATRELINSAYSALAIFAVNNCPNVYFDELHFIESWTLFGVLYYTAACVINPDFRLIPGPASSVPVSSQECGLQHAKIQLGHQSPDKTKYNGLQHPAPWTVVVTFSELTLKS